VAWRALGAGFWKYNVETTVVNGADLSIPENIISVMIGMSDIKGLSRVYGHSAGKWFTQATRINGIDYAHEAGHLLGLPDETATGSLMDAGRSGIPSEREINNVLNSKSNIFTCGCE
jgi:hypothetical protein